MLTADFDHNDFNTSAQNKLDESLLVKFFTKQREDKAASLKEGRPIFKDVEYVDIKVAGNRSGGASRPCTYADKQRFPRHYAAYQQRQEMPMEGTPLSEWPLMTRSQVEELSFYHVKTVEQLVEMSDTQASKFMGMNGLKAKAKAWLEKTDETARINEIEVLKTSNSEKDDRIITLEGQMLSMMDKLDSLEKENKPKSKKTKV